MDGKLFIWAKIKFEYDNVTSVNLGFALQGASARTKAKFWF